LPIKRITFVDHDLVESSNLERQFPFSTNDIGDFKVNAIERYAALRAPKIEISKYKVNISGQSDIWALLKVMDRVDVCCVCVDTPTGNIFETCGNVLWESNVPFIYGGATSKFGFWGPLFHRNLSASDPRAFKFFDTAPDDQPHSVSFPPLNTIVASMIAAEVLHYLSGLVDKVNYDSRTIFNLHSKECLHFPAEEWNS
jgi:molybdopterin/thiamine biosynthesis adenylyltransferase